MMMLEIVVPFVTGDKLRRLELVPGVKGEFRYRLTTKLMSVEIDDMFR